MRTTQKKFAAIAAGISLVGMFATATPVLAQSSVTTADIQRLQDEVYQASTDVSRLRTSDALAAGKLQDELDSLREDVIYLKVKLRRENSISRSDYNDIRNQLDSLRSRARGDARTTTVAETTAPSTSSRSGSSGSAPIYDDRSSSPTTTRQGRGI